MQTKKDLRAQIRQMLGSQNPEARKKQSLKVQKKLFSLPAFKKAKVVCFYVSLISEVDTTAMIDEALKKNKRVLVPRVDRKSKSLSLHEIYDRRTDLKKGSYGVMEPRSGHKVFKSLEAVDCLIVPGIGFDKKNNRLGNGAGYYDRFLKKFGAEVFKIGLAFSFQVVARIPVENHDVAVDLVLTD